jgi:hypothetical protein
MFKSGSGKVGKRKSRLKKQRVSKLKAGKLGEKESTLRSLKVHAGVLHSGVGPITAGHLPGSTKIKVPTYKNYNKKFFKGALKQK